MVLTERQRNELHLAIHDYLQSQGKAFEGALRAFEADAEVNASPPESRGLLEKKWTSVVRLQRKVMELEQRVEELQKKGGGAVRPGRDRGDGRCLPRAPPKAVLSGHRSPVTAVALHPKYTLLVSGGEDATMKVWDYESGEFERTLKGHTNAVQHVAFNAVGNMLASCSADLTIKLWEFADAYPCVRTLRGHDHNVSCIAFLPSSAELVSCSRDKTIRVWEVATGYSLRTLQGHTDWVRSVAVSADGALLASCGNDRSVRIWNLADGHLLHDLREHEHVVESVAFSNGTADKAVSIALASAAAGSGGGGAAESLYLVSASRDKTVKLWRALTGECLRTFADHDNWVRCALVHPTGPFILSCSDDRSIRVFDAATGRCVRALEEAHEHFVTAIAMSATAGVLASAGVDKNIHIWECV
ncbi:unnamed protein product [Phaeothamnion confervicola]